MKDTISNQTRKMMLSQLVKNRISELLEITFDTNSRRTEQIYARLIFIKYFTDLKFTTTRIGEMINKNHSTITYNQRQFKRDYETSKYFRDIYDEFMRVPIYETINYQSNDLQSIF